jgi:hypothetical protein
VLDQADPDDPRWAEAFLRGLELVAGDLEIVLRCRRFDGQRQLQFSVESFRANSFILQVCVKTRLGVNSFILTHV